MAFKFVLLVASLACASAGYIPSDPHLHLSYAPATSYSTVTKHGVPAVTKTIVQEPQLYHGYGHGYAHAAPSVVVSKPLAISSPLPVSYGAAHGIYQAPALVNNIEYSKPLSYAPVAKTILAEPAYGKALIAEPVYAKTIVSEPIYNKQVYGQPIYGEKTLIAEPVYGKTLIAEPTYAKTIVSEPIYNKNVYAEPIYGAKTLIAEPVYGKSIIAQPAPIYGEKVLSYAPKLAYDGISAHGW
ncbi:uncharacterized protein LOC125956121 isoform X2 [Anopheles darlingi]|uniref:uncharacterized protein LOC125956121 isoform X1 n=1 Tax=Anopheles darlingi TaxID=43151 RepID=UPI0021002EC4|nr:uncharacterized protein LOC125956121 isoform X1 [Anopheles darlingi]XP_049543647.1 uncharacterized protein LOC125956121 isoform X2 [Anopheles darlingi]